MSVFTIDGVGYNVFVPSGGIKRSGKVLDGDKAGRMQSGRMERDIIGTYYNYAMTVDTAGLSSADYDAMYQVITAPVDYHNIVVPYGQGTLSFRAYIANVDDELIVIDNGRNVWGKLAFNFVAMSPERT